MDLSERRVDLLFLSELQIGVVGPLQVLPSKSC